MFMHFSAHRTLIDTLLLVRNEFRLHANDGDSCRINFKKIHEKIKSPADTQPQSRSADNGAQPDSLLS